MKFYTDCIRSVHLEEKSARCQQIEKKKSYNWWMKLYILIRATGIPIVPNLGGMVPRRCEEQRRLAVTS